MSAKPASPQDKIVAESPTVACDGGGGALGHPKVYLNMEGKGEIECPYCSRHFVLSADAPSGGH
jgi:uncharacterized Zn-finger protein